MQAHCTPLVSSLGPVLEFTRVVHCASSFCSVDACTFTDCTHRIKMSRQQVATGTKDGATSTLTVVGIDRLCACTPAEAHHGKGQQQAEDVGSDACSCWCG
jgi:hypothetical protein